MKSQPPTDQRRMCHPGQDSDNVKIERDLENLIPPLSGSELADLHKSLDAEGCRDALIVWKGHNTLVDGHNRIKHCRERGYSFPVIEKEFANKDAVRAYIIDAQLGRRNLSPAAESYLRGKRYLETKRQGERTDLDATSGQSDQKTTAERLGEEFAVGEKTIRRDARFAEAVDLIVENCEADAKNVILSREYALTRGNVFRLAKLKSDEQRKYIKELKETGKRPRKARKGKKRETITIPTQPQALVQTLLSRLGTKELAEVSEALAEAIRQQREQGAKQEGEPTQRRKRKTKR